MAGVVERDRLDLPGVRAEVEAHLAAFVERRAGELAALGMPDEIAGVLRGLLFAGGKRLRPVLCVTGWYAAGGEGPPGPVTGVAASLEMFHTFALIHDDLIDGSATRRSAPAAHRSFAAAHPDRPDNGDFGRSAALLLGDLALAWSDELLHTAGLPAGRLAEVLALADTMRTEVFCGQYLDLLATGTPSTGTGRALTIARYKTAKYTVERPLHLGAAAAGADESLREALSAFAVPLGEAFQLRDDLLGTFGDPGETGKPCLDDLRAGKDTVLITLAMRTAGEAQRRELLTLVGDPALDEQGAARVRRILEETGARAGVEKRILDRYERAHDALERAALPPAAATALKTIALAATARTR